MGATANLILRISTVADLAGVKAGLDMVTQFGGKVLDAMRAVDDFADAHQRLSLDVSRMISSTRGMIAAQDAYVTANKLASAGIKASAQELEGLGKKAVEYAQATGQDVPAALQQLTQAVMSGSSRGLRPFGVDLAGVTDKTEAAKKALGQFAAEMSGVTVQVDSLTDALDALGNNLGDAAKRMAEFSGVSQSVISPLLAFNDALSTFNELMEKAPEATGKWLISLKGIGLEMANVYAGIISNLLTPLEAVIEVISKPVIALAEFIGLGETNPITLLKQAIAKGRDMLSQIASERMSNYAYDQSLETAGAGRTGQTGVGAAFGAAVGGAYSSAVEGARGAIKKGGSRGGGRRAGREADMVFSEEEVATYEEQMRDDLLDTATPNGRYAGVKYTVDDMIEEEKQRYSAEQIQLMLEWIDARQQMADAEVSFAERYGEAWDQSLQRVAASTIAANGAQNLLRGTIGQVAEAIVGSSKMSVKAFMEMIKGVGLAVGIESTLQGLMEGVRAAVDFAKPFGIGAADGARHIAAAAEAFVVAGIGYAVAGGATAIGKAAGGGGPSSRSERTGGAGEYGSPGYGSLNGDRDRNVSVNITLEGDAGGVFRVVDRENKRRGYAGESTLAA